MALVDGSPSIRLEGDYKRALALVPEGRLLLQKAQALVQRADVPTYSLNRQVSRDEHIYVLCAGGVNIIQISAGVHVPNVVHEIPVAEHVSASYPDFLSGVVFNGTVIDQEETRPDGSRITYKVLRQWAPTPDCASLQKLNLGRQGSRRLAVYPHSSHPEWDTPAAFGSATYSQYALPRASEWSGTMRKVVQVVMGLGRLSSSKLLDPQAPTLRTGYMRDVSQSGVQVRFDYRFMRTHGAYRGNDGTLWLVEISAGFGVLAMPMPIFSGSDTAGFLERAQARGDDSMVVALQELKCLPTGEIFPTGAALDSKIASGDVLQLMTPETLGEFYKLSGYSSSCGWAFNESGTEAHNVGYQYPDNEIFQRGYWYQLSIDIGDVNESRKAGEPVATGSARLRLQQRGFLYSPPVKNSYIPVKYYEPLLPGLLSHSAKPLEQTDDTVTCDTAVFVAFMNGDLKVAKYFRPEDPEQHVETFDTRAQGECLLDGEWTWGSFGGYRSLPAMPYTNDVDPRTILEGTVVISKLTSESLGFDPPQFSDFIESPETCFVWRNKVYRQTEEFEIRGSELRQGSLIIPGLSREAYYYFEGHLFADGRSGTKAVSYADVKDPNVGYGWRDFPRIIAPGWPPGYGCDTENCGGLHSERRIVCRLRETDLYAGPWVVGYPADCRSYADSGEWLEQCQDVVSISSPAPTRHNTLASWNAGQDFEGSSHFYSNGLYGPVVGTITQNELASAMRPSPDPDSGVAQVMFAEHSALGDDCVIYTKGVNGDTVVTGYTPVPFTEDDFMPTFIGVNAP